MKALGIDTTQFFAQIKETDALVSESIKRILMTRPFERPNRPSFGIGAEQFLFTHIDLLRKKIEDLITSQLQTYEPRIILDDILLEQTAQNNIKISVLYHIRENYEEGQLITSVTV